MYPTSARHIPCQADPLLTALRVQGLLLSEATICAVQISFTDQHITLQSPQQLVAQAFACPANIYQALYTLLSQQSGRSADDVLLLEQGNPTVGLADAASTRTWLRTPTGPAAAPAPVATPAPAIPAPVLLASHRSDHIVPLDGRFDASAMIYGGATPAGVRVVAVVHDEFQNVLVLSHPTDTGTVIQDATVREVLTGLLTAAAAVDGAAVVCDLRSERSFAVSRATMISILARQQVPNLEPPLVGQMTAYAPAFLADAAMHARAWATGGDTFRKVWATILFLVCSGLTVACGLFWYWAGVYPLIWTATRMLTGTDLDAAAVPLVLTTTAPQLVAGGVAGLTAIRLLAWVPSLLEFVGVMFSSFRWMQYVLFSVAGLDVFGNTIYYFLHFYPDVTNQSPLMKIVLVGSTFIGALMGGTVAALGFEPLTIILLVMVVALSPVVPWALRSSIEGLGTLVLQIYYGAVGIGDTLSTQRTILHAEASTPHYVYMQGAPPARRSAGAVAQTFVVVGLLVGIGAVGIYLFLGRGH